MSKCRACLKSVRNMITFDEKYIMYFNILTNLNLELSRDPQYLCKHCFKTLQQFIEFREKCIAANAVFSDIIPKENIKQEHSFEKEVKQETEIDDHETVTPFELEDYCVGVDSELKYDNDFVYELISKTGGGIKEDGKSRDIIRTKRKTKYTKEKKATLEENGKSKDIKKTKRKSKYTKKKVPNDEISKSNNIKTVKTKEKSVIFESNAATSLPCGLCTKSLEDNTQLDLHILSTHKQTKSCYICEEKFVDWQELMSHRAKHLPAARHSCHLCPKKFKTALWLEYHFRKNHHTEGEKQTLRCKLCDRRYPTPRRLQFHHIDTHNTKNKMFVCDTCDKVCYSKNLIKAHLLTHMDNNKPYRCDVCGYSSKYRATITGHKMAKHNPDRVYCVKCKKMFASAALREQHVCKWLDAASVCPVCGKTCYRLKRHMLVHSEGQPFACERCPARFRNSATLAIHMDKHAGVRRYACDHCPARFYFPSVLCKHRRTHTGIKPYVCKICQKAFTGNNNLKVHMKVHGKFLIKKKEESLHEEIQIEKVIPTSG